MITANLSQQQFDDLAEKLRTTEGITLSGTSGTVHKASDKVNWSFQSGVLTLECVDSFLISKAGVENRLKDALVAAGVVLTPPA